MKKELVFSLEDDELRIALKKYLTENCIMNKRIAKLADLREPYVSSFLKGEKILPKEKLDIIRDFINN